MPRKRLVYDATGQPGPPNGPISGPWERMVQWGLHFWVLDLLALFIFCYLTTGFSLFNLFGLPRHGIIFTTHNPLVAVLGILAGLVLIAWNIYRIDRRGWWDEGPAWFRWFDFWLP